jgi:hypothetical protein
MGLLDAIVILAAAGGMASNPIVISAENFVTSFRDVPDGNGQS